MKRICSCGNFEQNPFVLARTALWFVTIADPLERSVLKDGGGDEWPSNPLKTSRNTHTSTHTQHTRTALSPIPRDNLTFVC